MLGTSQGILYLCFVILAALPIALAHGLDDATDMMNMSRDTHSSMSMQNMESDPDVSNYCSYSEHTGLMYAHIILMIISWVVLMPLGKCICFEFTLLDLGSPVVAVMLSIARSRFTIVS